MDSCVRETCFFLEMHFLIKLSENEEVYPVGSSLET